MDLKHELEEMLTCLFHSIQIRRKERERGSAAISSISIIEWCEGKEDQWRKKMRNIPVAVVRLRVVRSPGMTLSLYHSYGGSLIGSATVRGGTRLTIGAKLLMLGIRTIFSNGSTMQSSISSGPRRTSTSIGYHPTTTLEQSQSTSRSRWSIRKPFGETGTARSSSLHGIVSSNQSRR